MYIRQAVGLTLARWNSLKQELLTWYQILKDAALLTENITELA